MAGPIDLNAILANVTLTNAQFATKPAQDIQSDGMHAALKKALRKPFFKVARGPGYPYDSAAQWLTAQQNVAKQITQANAIQNANEFADRVAFDTGMVTERVWKLTQFGDLAQRGLAMGVTFAAAGAALGSIVPGIGTIVGAVVGFIAGIIYTIIPIEQWNVIDTWKDICKGLMPVERYLVWKSCREIMDKARALTSPSEAKLTPWEAKKPVLYTIYTADGVQVFCFEELARQDCFPWPMTMAPPTPWVNFHLWDPVAQYAIAALTGFCAADEKVKDCYVANYIRNDGKGSQWLKEYLDSAADAKIADVRAVVTAAGWPDYGMQPYPPHVLDTLYQREAERQAQLKAAGAK